MPLQVHIEAQVIQVKLGGKLEYGPIRFEKARIVGPTGLCLNYQNLRFSGGQWVFDQPFYMLLNLAVGGSWPGPPNAQTVFPARMLVDWVRLYS